MHGDKFTKILDHEIESVNMHLPRKRISLQEAIIEEKNHYVARDGTKLFIDPKEIELLREFCPKNKMRDLFLPILIIRRRELGSGVYAVAGELIDEYVVARAIGTYDGSWLEYLENRKNPLYIYKPQLLLLRKKLRTATVIGFA